MGERMDKRIRFYIYWILGLCVSRGLCAPEMREDVYTEMRALLRIFPCRMETLWPLCPLKGEVEGSSKVWKEAKDSLVRCNHLAMTLKTYLITSQLDSACKS